MTLKKKMNESFFLFVSNPQVKTCFSREKSEHTSREQLVAAQLFPCLSSLLPVCSSAKQRKSRRTASHWPLPPAPPSLGTRLISGCLCHGLEMTGAGSPSPWQATAQITPLPERANALLMNNKSTLITNCQPNQLALQLSQTARLGTAARHYAARCLLLNHLIFSTTILLHLSFQSGTHLLSTDARVLKHCPPKKKFGLKWKSKQKKNRSLTKVSPM